MKKDIHPEYNSDATIKCVCGNKFKLGSTKKETEVEICANCHPFFTGKKKIIDTAGRVEKFKARVAAKKPTTIKKPRIKKENKKKIENKKVENKKTEKKEVKK